MRSSHFVVLCSCSLVLAVTMIARPAAAEPVQAVLTADEATVGLWRFEEGQGETVAAVKGPAGKLHGATWVPGRDAYALSTHSGYVSIPDAPALHPAKALTLEVWVKLNQEGGDLLCKNGVYMIRLGSTMSASLGIDGRWRRISGHRTVPLGRWTHLAVTYDSETQTAALYVDGALDATQKIPGLSKGLLSQGGSALRLGSNDWSPVYSKVDGKIGGLRISNIARTFEPLSSATSSATRAPAPKGNLVPNGDFELGLLGWRLTGEGDATLLWGPDATGPASGRQSLRTLAGGEPSVDRRTVGPATGLLSRPVAACPGARYTLTARMRGDSPGGRAAIAAIAAGGGGGRRGGGSFRQEAKLTADWQTVSRSFVLPDDWAAPSLCVQIEPPRTGQFWVDDVRLAAGDGAEALTLRDKIGVSPKAAPVGRLFFAGQAGKTTLDVVNTDAKDHRITVQASVVDWDGKRLPAITAGTFDVPAGGVKEVPFSIDTSRRGTFRLGFELTAEGETWPQAAEFKYAVIVPLRGVGAAEDSIFAMNTHMEREPTAHLAHNMEVLSQCGVKWIRGWWGWGMCEKEPGKFDWTEYDRQLDAVEKADMRLMPILLRYYPQYEQAWAGRVDEIARSPYKMEQWGAFVRKVVERYKGRVTAWELWNEPTTAGGDFTPEKYAELLRVTAPPMRELDPKAKLVAFASVEPSFIKRTLAMNTASMMDVISDHPYGQTRLPETGLTATTATLRGVMSAAGVDKPIWFTEQGLGGDDDGYMAASGTEADVAALYTRNLVVAGSLGVGKYFWFSAQTSPTYGMAEFYEDYIPRPRLTALNACASFLEGTTFRRAFHPSPNTYAFLFEGAKPACVVWSLNVAATLRLPGGIQAFDLMGNPVSVTTKDGVEEVPLAIERPVYLRCAAGDYGVLEKALAEAKVSETDPVAIAARPAAGGVEVTVTSQSRTTQDGVVDLSPAGATEAASWPAPQHFHSLAPGESRSLKFALPEAARSGVQVRARVGDREMREIKRPL